MTQHTPGPWHVFDSDREDAIFHRGRTVCAWPNGQPKYGAMAVAYCDYHTPTMAEANAQFIVRACNSYDDMLSALRTVGDVLARRNATRNDDELWAAFSHVIAAIAKATGARP